MRSKLIPFIVTFLTSLTASHSPAVEMAKYTWSEVKAARYYLLIVTLHDKSFYVRTAATEVILEEGAFVRLLVMNEQGRVIGWPLPTISKLPTGSYQLAARYLNSSPADLPAPVPALERPSALPAPAPIAAPLPAADLALPASPKEPATQPPPTEKQADPELSAEMDRLAELASQEEEAFKSTSERHLSLEVGLASDRIEAAGGSSTFNGSSKALGFGLQFWWRFITGRADLGALLGVRARLHLHNFVTTKIVKIEASGASSQEKVELGRSLGSLNMEHVLFAGDLVTVYAGYGLAYFQSPRMQVTNRDNGASELASYSLTGIPVRFGILGQPTTAVSLHCDAEYWPLVIGEKNASRWQLGLDTRYEFLGPVYAQLSLNTGAEKQESTIACPSSVSDCRSKATSAASLSFVGLGMGLTF